MKTMHESAAALYPSTQAVTPTAASAFTSAALGLDGLKIRTPALVAGLLARTNWPAALPSNSSLVATSSR